MNCILAIPIEVRLILLFFFGTVFGSLANWAVYRFSWIPRPISPWMKPHQNAPARQWSDRLPIFGWLGLRREWALHGSGFWIRPMFMEFFCGLGIAALYVWEIKNSALYPAGMPHPPIAELAASWPFILHEQYTAHVILIWLMLVASLIDVDEKIIPDAISRPGTLLGIVLAAIWPWSLLPDVTLQLNGWNVDVLKITSPNDWPDWLNGFPNFGSLAIALTCWALWCLAIMPRTWYVRHGWRRAIGLCWMRLLRQTDTYRIMCLFVIGLIVIAGVWYIGNNRWTALLTALVGMAVGGGIIWAVRILGRMVLNQEAMGFGDVTLMCMIGAFLGWQTCLMIFFLAPFAALVVGIARYFLIRDKEIPYGPFLCMATLVVILYWDPIWDWAWGIFSLGWFIPLVMLACLIIMAPLLFLIRAISNLFH